MITQIGYSNRLLKSATQIGYSNRLLKSATQIALKPLKSIMREYSNRVMLCECLYWDCVCGARNIEHWTAKELSSKHIERLRRKGKAIGQSYWYVAAPSSVICASCEQTFECIAFVSE